MYRFVSQFLLATSLVALVSCQNGKVAPEPETIDAYHATCQNSQSARPDDSLDVYIDVSSGMETALKDFLPVYKNFLQMANGAQTNYYRIGATETPVKIDGNQAEQILTSDFFKDDQSKLDVALRAIAANPKRAALFVTDFNHAPNVQKPYKKQLEDGGVLTPIQLGHWAQTFFSAWLGAGGEIDAAASHSANLPAATGKAPIRRNLYFLLFTPANANPALRDRMKAQGLFDNQPQNHYASVHLSPRHAAAQTRYDSQETAGLSELIAAYPVHARPEKGYDYYGMEALSAFETVAPQEVADKRLLKKIFLQYDPRLYPNLEPEIRVYDQTANFESYQNFAAENITAQPEFDPETGKPLPAKKPQKMFQCQKGTLVNELFTLVKNEKTQEMGLKFHPNFQGVSEPKLYRVEIQLKNAAVKPSPEIEAAYVWRHPDGYPVPALFDSMKGALAAQSANTPLYVYYIYLQ